ncbi:ABC transporter permease [Haloferax volcanii]|uniref:ABC transporter permease n=1 Tax=Haloferax volcanii TaxID=2246 RepID=UPI0023DC28F8|nr:ABC transporter permease [Haloferax lucentense]
MAWRNLWRNGMRTALAALGIIIGVIAIAALGITGTALQYSATSELGDLTNQFDVTTGEDAEDNTFSETQVQEIERIAAGATVVPQKSDRLSVTSRTEEMQTSVTALTQASELHSASAGEVPDQLRTGVLLGSSAADELGVEVGDVVTVGEQSYRVRGILAEQVSFRGGGGTVIVPLSAMPDQEYATVTVITADGDAANQTATEIEDYFNEREELVSASTQDQLNTRVSGLFDTLNAALLGVGSISMLVAGVSILNVMLMSTMERRGEIGLLRAVGVRRFEILRMILAEALLLGVVGGAVGATISLAIGYGLNSALFSDPTLVFQWDSFQYVVLGFGFGALSSFLSGIYPAWKAANNPPVEALRG